MRNLFLTAGIAMALFSCQQNNQVNKVPSNPNIHMAIALDKINTSKYTYLLVNENGVENWLAFPLAEVTIGEPYYYSNEMLMTNFESKELGRVFEKVYFVPAVYLNESDVQAEMGTMNANPEPVSQVENAVSNPTPNSQPVQDVTPSNPDIHKGIALEKLNTTKYTYLLLEENGTKKWLAFPLANIKIGATYYYSGEMLMEKFESKELNRTFDKVYFIQGVSLTPPIATPPAQNNMQGGTGAVKMEKQDVAVEPAKDGITIAQLYAKQESLEGKRITIKGKVVKFSAAIMGKNWIHIQDGSDYKGKFDLTITSQESVNVGGTFTFEGTVARNKDFGAGYSYDVLLEEAKVK